MNANSATTNAPTTNAPRTVYITCFGHRYSHVEYDDMKKVRTYMKKKGSQGYRVTECVILSRTVFVTISNCSDGVARTPGYQRVMSCRHNDGNGWIEGYDLVHLRTSKLGTAYLYVAWGPKHPIPEPTPVKYGVRTIKNGIVTDWTTFDDELDARTYADCNVQSDWTGETTASIIPIMPDGSLGGIMARIVYIDPNDGDDWIDSDDDDDEPEPESYTVKIWSPYTDEHVTYHDVTGLDTARFLVENEYQTPVFYSIRDNSDGIVVETGEYDPNQGVN